ncbi:hypothetical protein L596_009877 [Steinernema carpocapsae]|uniref:Uncharacterized protein n=1 Tax=Steinernema carpocapsae TaxID=34508 RepID=A0A4U5PHF6_STECR|nr:hypothetical protein L596_009877 [Steinernema carpocapsae]
MISWLLWDVIQASVIAMYLDNNHKQCLVIGGDYVNAWCAVPGRNVSVIGLALSALGILTHVSLSLTVAEISLKNPAGFLLFYLIFEVLITVVGVIKIIVPTTRKPSKLLHPEMPTFWPLCC